MTKHNDHFLGNTPKEQIDWILRNREIWEKKLGIIFPGKGYVPPKEKEINRIGLLGHGIAVILKDDGTWNLEDTTGG